MWKDPEHAKEYWRGYTAQRYARRKNEAVEFLGGQCHDCGITSNLEFDHVNPETKLYSIATILLHGWPKILSELEKCVLRCQSCHAIRTSTQQGVAHGAGLSGKKNCKCAPCKAQKREYMKNWKLGLRAGAQAGLANPP